MARPALLPLPADQDAALNLGVRPLLENFPLIESRQSTRPFCAAFLRLVYQVTGQVFGASTYRKLFAIYAPQYRPATQTIDTEIKALRVEMQPSWHSTERDNSPLGAQPIYAVRRAGRADVEQVEAALELSRLQKDEIARLRAQVQQLLSDLRVADQARVAALSDAAAAQARAAAEYAARRDLEATIEKLTERVQSMQARSDAVQRQALLHVDRVRNETRQEEEKRKKVEQQLANTQRELRSANELVIALRRQMNAEREQARGNNAPG